MALLFLLSFLFLALSSVYAAGPGPTAAVYALSNNVSGNELYIYTVNLNDGSLTYAYAIPTGGNGAGVPHSQGSLTRSGNYLFAVNGGSNSVSLFFIDGTNATNVSFVQSANVQGSLPTSVAVTPLGYGYYACVATSSLNLTISCFTYNQTGLTALPGWTRYLGIYVNDSSYPLSEVAFSPTASYLVAQVKGHFTSTLVYPIANGNISTNPQVTPSGISTSPLGPQGYGFVFTGTNSILTTDAAVGLISYSFNNLGSVLGANNHSLTPAGATGYCWVVASPLTKDYYAISAQNITEVSVGSDGTITQQASKTYPTLAPLSEATIVSTASGVDYLYVLSKYEGVTQYKITSPGQFAYTRSIPYPNNGTNNTVSGIASALSTSPNNTPSSASTVGAGFSILLAGILATLMAL